MLFLSYPAHPTLLTAAAAAAMMRCTATRNLLAATDASVVIR